MSAVNTTEKGLPTNVDAERFVLGSIMLDDSLYIQAAGELEPDDFSLDNPRRIFRHAQVRSAGEREPDRRWIAARRDNPVIFDLLLVSVDNQVHAAKHRPISNARVVRNAGTPGSRIAAEIVIGPSREGIDSLRHGVRYVHPQRSAARELHGDGCVGKGQSVLRRHSHVTDLWLRWPPIWFKMQGNG